MRCERCRRKRFRGGSAELEESSVFLSSEKDDARPLAAQVRGRENHCDHKQRVFSGDAAACIERSAVTPA